MKKCPVCSEALRVEEYEGLSIWRCPGCRGALVSGWKNNAILSLRERTTEQLGIEARSEFTSDTMKKIRCPRCGGQMDKRWMRGSYGNLNTDVCTSCSHVWFDGGELATAQLTYEISDGAADVEEHKRRGELLDSDLGRKVAFEEAMKHVPDELPCQESNILDEEDAKMMRTIFRLLFR